MSVLVAQIMALLPGIQNAERYRAYLLKQPEAALKQKMAGLLEDQTRRSRPGGRWEHGRFKTD